MTLRRDGRGLGLGTVTGDGALVIAGQNIHIGIGHAGRTVTVEEADTALIKNVSNSAGRSP